MSEGAARRRGRPGSAGEWTGAAAARRKSPGRAQVPEEPDFDGDELDDEESDLVVLDDEDPESAEDDVEPDDESDDSDDDVDERLPDLPEERLSVL